MIFDKLERLLFYYSILTRPIIHSIFAMSVKTHWEWTKKQHINNYLIP